MTPNTATFTPYWWNEWAFSLRATGRKVPGFPCWHRRTEYEYTSDAINPPTFHIEPNLFVRPDRHGFTDMGSVPEFIQVWVQKDLHLPSFILHDSACRERCLYYSETFDGPYECRPISSRDAARLLGLSLSVSGYPVRGPAIGGIVRAFGPHFRAEL
jgi:hypothetical protein